MGKVSKGPTANRKQGYIECFLLCPFSPLFLKSQFLNVKSILLI